MKFNDPAEVEMLCYQMKMADYPRAQNRARINELFNGFPPYSDQEVQENQINVNVNFLEGTVIAHEGRTQFNGAFLKPGRYFSCVTDSGPRHKRSKYATVVTKEINKIMKRSMGYYECFRSKFALDVLHGIGPSVFRDADNWCPQPVGVEDVMLPAKTLLTMENVPFFAIYRSYTAPELIKLTRGPKMDKGWNMDQVEAIIKWIDRSTMALMGSNWPEVWSPEKASERVKGDGGFYVGDQVPTVDVWDFYFYADDGKECGWKRRMILDSWSTPAMVGGNIQMNRRKGDIYETRMGFLYDPGDRFFARDMKEIVNFQFADLSCYAPFQYHSVRSLGFLMYATCHLQNRLRCKFNEAVFEALLMYFKVKNLDEAQRALKIELANRGFIDDSLMPLPANERFQVNSPLVELGLMENRGLITRHSNSYSPVIEAGGKDKREKTKFEVQAEIQQMTSLVNSGLMQAYSYQNFEYREVFRRFCKPNSPNGDVNSFQAACLRQGVPEKMLKPELWEIDPERVLGAGNKTLEMAIAEQLMQFRPLYDPSAQRTILREVTQAITDDPARAELYVPEQPEISSSVHDAELRWGTLMAGAPVSPKDGVNHSEVIEVLLTLLGQKVQSMEQGGGMPQVPELMGMNNVAAHIAQEIQLLSVDPNQKQQVRQYGQALGQIVNLLKAFGQRLQEAMQAGGQNGQQGMDPKDMAKIQAMQMQAQAKQANTRESHAQRTAQRQIQFELEQRREQARHEREMEREAQKAGIELAKDRTDIMDEMRYRKASTQADLAEKQASVGLDLAAKRAMVREELAAKRAKSDQAEEKE